MPGTYEAIPLLTLIHKLACGKLRTRTIITNVPKTESSLCRIFVNQHVTQGPEIARIQAVVGQIFLSQTRQICLSENRQPPNSRGFSYFLH